MPEPTPNTFEGAAAALLDTLMDATRAVCAEHRIPERACLRGIFHRGQQSTTGIVASPDHGELHLYSSRTAWWALDEHAAPLMIDLFAQKLLANGVQHPHQQRSLSEHSERFFMEQGTTHIIAMPGYDRDGQLSAMITIELRVPMRHQARWQGLWETLEPALSAIVAPRCPQILPLPRSVPDLHDDLLPVVGERTSPLVDTLRKFARYDDTILLTGETGVGKSHLARWIHSHSSREGKPFEVVHLQNTSEDLVAGELFGWCRGAHSQATRDRTGHVARAEGGTLFIDEIDRLPLKIQNQLLRLLEARRYHVLGDSGPERTADVRFIIGTNANLSEAIAERRFHKDLYYRIAGLTITIPPLRERRDEIKGWARVMLRRLHSERRRSGRCVLSDKALALLEQQRWPGNLRELESTLRRSWTYAEQPGNPNVTISPEHVLASLERLPEGPAALASTLRAAARAFAEAIMADPERLPLTQHHIFHSYIVDQAVTLHNEDTTAAFRALGQHKAIRGRNHGKVLRNAREKIADFEQAFTHPHTEPR